MSDGGAVVDVEDVTKRYGDVTALDGVSLSIEPGGVVGLLGTNGAGKTTLFKLLVGLDRPDAGHLSVAGVSPTAGPAVRRRVGYLPERAGFSDALTGREVLAFHARMRDVPRGERDERVARTLATVGLEDAADRRVAGYSNGMHRRLGLATALVARPAVLLLDEPASGLDPVGVEAFHAVVDRIATETDVTVVFSTHALAAVERLCERAVVLDRGRVRARGTVAELRRHAGDRVRVTLRLADPGDAPAATAAVEGHDDVSVTARGDGREFGLACPREEAFELVAGLHDAVEVEAFEVRHPGLDAAFRSATDAVPAEPSRDVASASGVDAVAGGESP